MIEPIGLNLIASGLATSGGIGVSKIRSLLRQRRFADDIDDLTTEFTSALKSSVPPAIEASTDVTDADGAIDWSVVATEFDEQFIAFADEADAIVQITDAIDAGIERDLDADPAVRTGVEAGVVDAYQTTVQTFAERVAGTALADVFMIEASLDLSRAIGTVTDRLTAIQRELRRDTAALRNAGFVRLDPLYFDRHETGNPDAAWRTGFSLAEVNAGYPLPRERPAPPTDARQVVAEQVYDRLLSGESLVVKGDGGTGKSTVCKRVACRWHDTPDRGPVFYRGSATTTSFDEPGTLIDALRATEQAALVVVEDAPSGGADAIFEVLAEFEAAPDVTFLLDARTSAWEAATQGGGHATLERQRQQLGIVEMPALDERECQRAIEHYEALTGQESGREGDQLSKKVRAAELGGPLVLAYQLTGPASDTDRPVSALHADVRHAYTAVEEWADSADFPQTVATMVNVLNAAGLPVEAAFVHALADDSVAHRQIERTLGFLEGTMLEQSGEDLRLPHQLWSALYLQHMLAAAGERLARDRFERCVEALFRLVDDADAWATVRNWVRTPPEAFTAITETPEETAERFVRHLADIGTIRPGLGVVYGTPETWRVPLPDPCPTAARIQWFITRSRIHSDRGALDAAQAEVEHADRVIETLTENEPAERPRQRAMVHRCLGEIARTRGNLDLAEEHLTNSRALAQDSGDRREEAKNLSNLGLVAKVCGDLAAAEAYLKESLALHRELGYRHGEAASLTNLGNVANDRGELDAAGSYYEESLALFRAVGDRHGEAQSLHNLGSVAWNRGELDAADSYYEESLALFRELGNRQVEATNLTNLGTVAHKRGELDAADSYYEKALTLTREVGDRQAEAASLNNLGSVAHDRGELDAAEASHEEALMLAREVGSPRVEAECLRQLGRVAQARDDLVLAEDHLEASLALLREHDLLGDAFDVFGDLIDVCDQRGADTKSIEWCDDAIDCAEQSERATERERFQERRSELLDGDE